MGVTLLVQPPFHVQMENVNATRVTKGIGVLSVKLASINLEITAHIADSSTAVPRQPFLCPTPPPLYSNSGRIPLLLIYFYDLKDILDEK